jgi:lysozyme
MTLEDQLIRDEGLRLKPYKDSVGKTTIGIGRNLDDVGISQPEAMTLLENDIENASAMLRTRLPWTINLDDVRRAALINMTFNMGIGGLLGFRKFLAALEAGDYRAASAEMMDSTWYKQVGDRAHRLSVQIESGEWT